MNEMEIYYSSLETIIIEKAKIAGSIGHSTSTGSEREELVRLFLKDHLPGRYEISNGIIRDKANNRCDEMDCIIYDRNKHPKLYKHEGLNVLPCESIYGTIEIKSNLKMPDLSDCFKKALSFDRLIIPLGSRSVEELRPGTEKVGTYLSPSIPFFIFSFDGPKHETLVSNIMKIIKKEPIDVRHLPRAIYVGAKYCLTLGVTNSKRQPGYVVNNEKKNPLLNFFLSVFNTIEGIQLPRFNMLDYEDLVGHYDLFDVRKI